MTADEAKIEWEKVKSAFLKNCSNEDVALISDIEDTSSDSMLKISLLTLIIHGFISIDDLEKLREFVKIYKALCFSIKNLVNNYEKTIDTLCTVSNQKGETK